MSTSDDTDIDAKPKPAGASPEDTEEPEAGLTIAVIGATGAVGSDLVATLSRSALPIGELRLLASPASSGETVELDGRTLRVRALTGDPLESPLLEGVDLVFMALPPEVARPLGSTLSGSGMMVIDIGGALADRAPLIVPALGLHALPEAARARLVCSPSAATITVATVVGALHQLGPLAVRGTCLMSAGVVGKAGVKELSGQVVAMFNSQPPPRRVFPAGLAFDLQTQVGTVDPQVPGWTDAERRLAAEVSVLTELPPSRVAVGLALMPIFNGVAVSLHIDLEHDESLDEVRACLRDVPSLQLTDSLPGPRRLVGRADVYVGRLRVDPAGSGVHLWAVADNLRFAATGNAIAIATALWRDGLI